MLCTCIQPIQGGPNADIQSIFILRPGNGSPSATNVVVVVVVVVISYSYSYSYRITLFNNVLRGIMQCRLV